MTMLRIITLLSFAFSSLALANEASNPEDSGNVKINPIEPTGASLVKLCHGEGVIRPPNILSELQDEAYSLTRYPLVRSCPGVCLCQIISFHAGLPGNLYLSWGLILLLRE